MTDQILSRREAIEFIGLSERTFNNYFQNADEFRSLPRRNNRGPLRFNKQELQNWLDGYKWRTVALNIDDYSLCLDFALAQHLFLFFLNCL